MARVCNNCKTVAENEKTETIDVSVPYVVHEATVARQERQIKRMWITLIVAISMIFLMNMAWIGAWTSYDYSSTTEEIIVEQDAQDGGNANYIGNDGVINNGISEDNNSQEEADTD